MGQAFDRDGNVLGEAFGETKRAVLDQLEKAHPDAEAILIRTLQEKMRAGKGVEAEFDPKEKTTAPVDRMMQFFAHGHLPPHLAQVSAPFCLLAEQIVATLPSNPERTVALRKLLEAKDCAVRALLYK